MGCLRLTYNTNLDLVKNEFTKDLTPNFSKNKGQSAYFYGFQGQEMDDEVKGEGNSINYKYRMHDPRVGRFFAVDPLVKSYPELTPYQFSSNSPIGMVEIEGLEGEWKFRIESAKKSMIQVLDQGGTEKQAKEAFENSMHPEKMPKAPYKPTRNYLGNVEINNTKDALNHYFNGGGESVDLSEYSQMSIFNSEDMQYYRERIKSGKTSNPSQGNRLGVNVTKEENTYHIGNTTFDYSTTCEGENCITTYTFSGDGFYDIFWGDDKTGSEGELFGGVAYEYNSFSISEGYKNPGYSVNNKNVPEANPKLTEEGEGPPNRSSSPSY